MIFKEEKVPPTEKAPIHKALISTLPEKFHFLEVKEASVALLSDKDKLFQRKLDGTAAEIFVEDNIRMFGRRVLQLGLASEYTKRFPELIKALYDLKIPKHTDFLGEIIVIDPNTGFESFELLQTRTQRHRDIERYSKLYPAFLIIHDVVKVSCKDISGLKYLDRLKALESAVKDWSSDYIFIIKNITDGLKEWEYVERNKLEGLVVREPNAPLNHGVWKVKREITEDVYCKGEYTPSESVSRATMKYKVDGVTRTGVFANLICYQLINGKEIHVANIGNGFTDKERQKIQAMLDKHEIAPRNPLVIEVKASGRGSSLKLRSPIFKRIRFDKPWFQCVIKSV